MTISIITFFAAQTKMVTIGDDIYMPNRVNGIIEHSIKNVDYYRNLGLKPSCNIESFPVLTKKILQDNPGSLLSDDELSNINNLLIKSSSGSSGIPTSVYWSQDTGVATGLHDRFCDGGRFVAAF